MHRRWLTLVVLALFVCFAMPPAESQAANPASLPPTPYTEGVVWVKLPSAIAPQALRAQEWQPYAVSGQMAGTQWVRLSVPKGEELTTANQLKARPDVLAAEPEYIVHATAIPNDPSFGQQWNLQKIQAPLGWDVTTGDSGVIVAVVDTGVDLSHPDLQANLWQNVGEIANNGIDDDQNGYVDDRWGWDVVNGDATPMDDNGHGTHVAGIVGAVGNNSIGIAGVAWRVSIMPVKVLDNRGNGTYAGVADGIRYAVANGARIVNMSLAGTPSSQLLQDTINDAAQQGVIFVAAAGNCAAGGGLCDGVNPIMYPAAMDHVISVASTDSADLRAPSSEYNAFVDVAAPGVSIYSLSPGGGYVSMTGTSMASPHVAALVALVESLRPDWTGEQVEAHLKATAVQVGPQPYVDGRNDYYGAGRINAAAALWSLEAADLSLSAQQLVFHAVSGSESSATLTLTNANARTAHWSAEVSPEDSWLSISPASGTVSETTPVTLTVTATANVDPGLYQGTVRVTCDDPYTSSDPAQVGVYLFTAEQMYQLRLPFVFVAGKQN